MGQREDAHSDPLRSAGTSRAARTICRIPQPAAQPANQPPHRTRNTASHRVRRLLFEHTSVRPRRSASALPPARRALPAERCHGTYYRPCSSITGMSDIKEVPAPVAGLPTARSPGRTPSAEYLKFLDEGGELIDMADFDFTDRALTPAIRPTHQSLQLMLDNVISILFHVNTRGRRGS